MSSVEVDVFFDPYDVNVARLPLKSSITADTSSTYSPASPNIECSLWLYHREIGTVPWLYHREIGTAPKSRSRILWATRVRSNVVCAVTFGPTHENCSKCVSSMVTMVSVHNPSCISSSSNLHPAILETECAALFARTTDRRHVDSVGSTPPTSTPFDFQPCNL